MITIKMKVVSLGGRKGYIGSMKRGRERKLKKCLAFIFLSLGNSEEIVEMFCVDK